MHESDAEVWEAPDVEERRMSKNRSKVHPNYKTRYRVRNWAEYDRALRNRGDITLWLTPAAIAAWTPLGTGARGGQRRYSDVAIEAALALRLVFGLAWRQTEGLLGSVLSLMGLDLEVPDHTTLSRRTAGLEVDLGAGPWSRPVHVVVDSTGVGLFGEGEWAAAKWGGRGRRGWRKLHVAVDEEGFIVAAELTENTRADASVVSDLLGSFDGPIRRFTADGAYDSRAVYELVRSRGGQVVVPPVRTATKSRGDPVLSTRDAYIDRIGEVGRRRWRQEVGQHEQARAENTFFRYKSAFGGRLKGRIEATQRAEVLTGCRILNRMAALGMPVSAKVEA